MNKRLSTVNSIIFYTACISLVSGIILNVWSNNNHNLLYVASVLIVGGIFSWFIFGILLVKDMYLPNTQNMDGNG